MWNLYTKQRHKTWTKYQPKIIQNAIITHCDMYDRPIQSVQIMHIIRRVTESRSHKFTRLTCLKVIDQ